MRLFPRRPFNLDTDRQTPMFIHKPVVKYRVLAVLLAVPLAAVSWLTWKLLGLGFPQNFWMWFIYGLSISIVAIGFGLVVMCWIYAPRMRNASTPDSEIGMNRDEAVAKRRHLPDILICAALIAYAAWSLRQNSFAFPTKTGWTSMEGQAMWMLIGAIVCIVANRMTVVASHYDRSDRKRAYIDVAGAAFWFAWTFFFAALIAQHFR